MKAVKGQPIAIPPVLSAIVFVLCFSAEAQQQRKVPRIGILNSTSPSTASRVIGAFQQSLRDLSYDEQKNIIIEYRYAEGKLDRLRVLADELVRLRLDVIITDSSNASQAAKNATETIPIVFTTAINPVGDDQVASLARPGGNVTGFSVPTLDLNGKRLELLKGAFPKIEIIGFLTREGTAIGEQRFNDANVAAKALGLRLQFIGAKGPDDLANAVEAAKRSGAEAVLAHQSSFVVTNRVRIIEVATKYRLPVIFPGAEAVEAGGLMSYGPDFADNYRRAAAYVDKILKGARPADLPVQQPTKFELVINLKAANQIGLTIPPNVLARADRVIR